MNYALLNATNGIRPEHAEDRLDARVIRTFLVDDSPLMLVLLAQLLARDERIMLVGSVADGPRAFQFASMSHPDLVLMDLHMPAADGAEITRWLKQLKNPPIVFVVTADDSPLARTRSLAAGADAFLVKTDDLPVRLQTEIQAFFGGRHEGKGLQSGHHFKSGSR